jgi:flagellar hook-associated protein 1
MTLSNAGSIASQSLGTISNQISVVSRNISGVNTTGYSAKTAQIVTVQGGAAGVSGVVRATNSALSKNVLQATAARAVSSVVADGLTQLDQFFNISSTSATDLSTTRTPAALISNLQSALQDYSAAPTSTTAAESAISAAKTLASTLNDATTTVQGIRQHADTQIASAVTSINTILTQFQSVNSEIVSKTNTSADITDLLDQRDTLISNLSQQIGVSTFTRPNNDVVIYADNGATLFETTARAVSFKASPSLGAGLSGNAVYIDGVQVTGAANASQNLQSGAIVGLTQLRDQIAPQFQNQLDETARGLIAAFAESDQTGGGAPTAPGLFTYANAAGLPSAAVIPGLASQIVVNANVDPTQGGDVTRLRDGGIADPTNAAYVYNTAGASGYSARITQLIGNLSTPQTFDAAAGLGAQESLATFTASSVGWLEAKRQQADKDTSYQDALLAQTTQALSNATGVNLDDQMSKMLSLENSYQASAKLLAAVNQLFSDLFAATHV